MRFLLLTGLLWVGAAFPGHIVASVAAAGAPLLPHTVYPHWAALQGQHGSFQYTNPFVLDIPKEWNAAVTSVWASFWHYLRARLGPAVTIHFVRNGEFTRYTIYGNAYGCLWALTCIYNAHLVRALHRLFLVTMAVLHLLCQPSSIVGHAQFIP